MYVPINLAISLSLLDKEGVRQHFLSWDDGFTAFFNIHESDAMPEFAMQMDKLVGEGVVMMVNPYGIPLEGVDHLQVMLQPGALTTVRLQGETVRVHDLLCQGAEEKREEKRGENGAENLTYDMFLDG